MKYRPQIKTLDLKLSSTQTYKRMDGMGRKIEEEQEEEEVARNPLYNMKGSTTISAQNGKRYEINRTMRHFYCSISNE